MDFRWLLFFLLVIYHLPNLELNKKIFLSLRFLSKLRKFVKSFWWVWLVGSLSALWFSGLTTPFTSCVWLLLQLSPKKGQLENFACSTDRHEKARKCNDERSTLIFKLDLSLKNCLNYIHLRHNRSILQFLWVFSFTFLQIFASGLWQAKLPKLAGGIHLPRDSCGHEARLFLCIAAPVNHHICFCWKVSAEPFGIFLFFNCILKNRKCQNAIFENQKTPLLKKNSSNLLAE